MHKWRGAGVLVGRRLLPAIWPEGASTAGAITGPRPVPGPLEKRRRLRAPSSSGIDPTGLAAAVTNSNTVTLTWTASSDNVGVVDHGVYRDGVEIATGQISGALAPAPKTFVDKNVPPGT